jgi:anaerobic magnesium-protoporphyrin IX monomethyl ester cyclase
MARVVLCQRVYYPLHGMMSISATLKASGHQVELVMETKPELAVKELLRIKPDVIGFSTLIAIGDLEWSVEVANSLKNQLSSSTLILIGGLYPTIFPDKVIDNKSVDAICLGEGEYPLLELCKRLDKKEEYKDVRGLWVKSENGVVKNQPSELIQNLDQLPFVDRDLYQKYSYFKNQDHLDVLAGRGCPFSCTFCYNSLLNETYKNQGPFVRKHSVDYVINEMIELKERFNPSAFRINDELFVMGGKWLEDFTEKYKQKIDVPFICTGRADLINDQNCTLLKAAGIAGMCVGLESGNEKIRNDLFKKKIKDSDLRTMSETLHRHDIKFMTTNMLGVPGESVEDAFSTIRLNREIKSDYVWQSVFLPHPGLPITKTLEEQGLIPKFDSNDFNTTYFKDSPVKTAEIRELVNLHKLFFYAFKFPRLEFLIRRLIKLPSNFIFEFLFMCSYAWLEVRFIKIRFRTIVRLGLMNLRNYYR